MSQDAGRRRSRGGVEDELQSQDLVATTSTKSEYGNQQSSSYLPEPKRRRAPSPASIATASPTDHKIARPPTASTTSTSPSLPVNRTHESASATYQADTISTEARSAPSDHPSDRSGRQVPSPEECRYSVSDRPETSSSSQSSLGLGLARLPSLSSIAQDLPVNTFPPHQSPRGLSSPISARSNPSRQSLSSRGSSPHASSSSSSSSAGRRRYASRAPDAGLSGSPSQATDFQYELVIHQQPGTAAAAGLSPPALSRLPVVPSPILQLRVKNGEGGEVGHRHVLQNLPYLVCSCSLVSADGENTPVDFASEMQPLPSSATGATGARRPSQPLAMMCGTRVYSSSEAVGRDSQPGIFFIFWDISVRQEGEYRLKFSLVEALPGSPTLATVISEPFKVVGRAEFPGTVEIATEWTRHMHRQGLNIYLPALGTSSATSASSVMRS